MKLNRRLLLAASTAALPVVALAQDRKKIVVGLLSWWPLAVGWQRQAALQAERVTAQA